MGDSISTDVRTTDPETSAIGAATVRMRAGTQRVTLLKAIRRARQKGLTSADAAYEAGLFLPGVCYWKRISELAQAGLVEAHGTRISDLTGSEQTVYRITPEGRAALDAR